MISWKKLLRKVNIKIFIVVAFLFLLLLNKPITKYEDGLRYKGSRVNYNYNTENLKINVKDFGAKGDGVTDDSIAINKAISSLPDGGTIEFPQGIYVLDTSNNIKPLSNQQLIGMGKCEFKIKYTIDSYQVIDIAYKDNVIIENISIIGDKDKHTDNKGDIGIGIAVSSSSNVKIINCSINNIWGDGISIGGKITSENVLLKNSICSNNRRNGASIWNARDIILDSCKFYNQSGASPECGVDIEPEPDMTCENISIYDCEFYQNRSGLDIFGWATVVNNVSVEKCTFYNNSDYGFSLAHTKFTRVRNSKSYNNDGIGIYLGTSNKSVYMNSVTCDGNGMDGMYIFTKDQQANTEDVYFENCKFINNSKLNPNVYTGVKIGLSNQLHIIKNIEFNKCTFDDTQDIKTQNIGLYIDNYKNITNINIRDNNRFYGILKSEIIGE